MIVDPSIPQPEPLQTPGVKTSAQIVDHLDKVLASQPPEVQAAVDHAHNVMGMQSPVQAPPASPIVSANVPSDVQPLSVPSPQAASAAMPAPLASSTPVGGPSVGSDEMGTPAAPKPLGVPASPHMAELERLHNTGSGISQIKNPFLRGLATVGDVAASGFLPQFGQFIPGTSAHHQQLIGQEENQIGQEQKATKATDASRLANAQATEQESLPELHKTQAELATSKLENSKEVSDAKQGTSDAKQALAESEAERKRGENETKIKTDLASHGFKMDPDTKALVPLPYEEMSEPQKAIHDLKASQSELADARSALVKAQKDNIPASMEMARKRIDNAQRSHDTAMERLGLSEKQYEMRAHGTENGEALPGSVLGDDNKPVGTAFQSNVRPTGTERNKADLASSAHEQLQDIKSIVAKRPDIFGPLAGRKTDFTVWVGSQDPDAQRFRAARTIAGDHLAGVFGGRSEAALQALDSAIGQFKDNPDALQSGLDQLDKANNRFVAKGTPKTAGSDAAKQPAGGTGEKVKTWNPKTGKFE